MIKAFFKRFLKFLQKNNAFALAIGVLIGNSVTNLANSIVTDLVKPTMDPALEKAMKASGAKGLKVNYGPLKLHIGDFINNLLKFVIIAIVIVVFSVLAQKYLF